MPKFIHYNGKAIQTQNKLVHGGAVKRPRDSVDKETVQPSSMSALVGMTGKMSLDKSQSAKAPSAVVTYGPDLIKGKFP
jgi:hypothetical protein